MDAEIIKARIDTLYRAASGEETYSPEFLQQTLKEIKEMVDELNEERQEAENEAEEEKLDRGRLYPACLDLIDEVTTMNSAIMECGKMLTQAKRGSCPELRDFAFVLSVLLERVDAENITQQARHIQEAVS